MDRITITGIRAYGRHGVSAKERAELQPFDVDVTVELNFAGAAASDDLADTLDYARLHERVVSTVASRSFALLERLARAILDVAFEDVRVTRAEVTVSKPQALAGATPSVTIARAGNHRSP